MPASPKPRETARMQKLVCRAAGALDRGAPVVYDVAAHFGQIVGNVRHMDWFLLAVMREIGSGADVALIPTTMTRIPGDWRPA